MSSNKPILYRFIEKVKFTNECWVWQGFKDCKGYGKFGVHGKTMLAHRWFYLQFASIPEGLHLDHLCRNLSCIKPTHLEPVTNRENIERGKAVEASRARRNTKTHCKNGHEFTTKNSMINEKGYRVCRECSRLKCKRRRLNNKVNNQLTKDNNNGL